MPSPSDQDLIRAPLTAILLLASAIAPLGAQEPDPVNPAPAARPVPRFQVLPLPYDQASVEREGAEISRYHFGSPLRRPFLYPLVGPSGRSLTRMGHPHDPNGHSHHNSVWVSHALVNGVDFWSDRGPGQIVHRRVLEYADTDDEARIAVVNEWRAEAGRVLLEERRTMHFQPRPHGWFLRLVLELKPPLQDVTFGKTPFGLVGVRMAKSIGVHDGGGRIRNSEGATNEKEVFWKPARWVDYSGPIQGTAVEGVTLMDHPSNRNHPSIFHVRDDGWMGASLSHAEPLLLPVGQTLMLSYGLYIHGGCPSVDELHAEYQSFCSREGR